MSPRPPGKMPTAPQLFAAVVEHGLGSLGEAAERLIPSPRQHRERQLALRIGIRAYAGQTEDRDLATLLVAIALVEGEAALPLLGTAGRIIAERLRRESPLTHRIPALS